MQRAPKSKPKAGETHSRKPDDLDEMRRDIDALGEIVFDIPLTRARTPVAKEKAVAGRRTKK